MSMSQSPSLTEGIRLLQAGDLAAAESHLVQAVQENPSDGRAYGYLGICRSRRGDLAGGILALQEAARLQPTDATAQYNLAVALTQAQRTAEARAALDRTLSLDPNHAKARAALASLGSAAGLQITQPSPLVPPPSPLSAGQPARVSLTGEPVEADIRPNWAPQQPAYTQSPAAPPVGMPPAPTAPGMRYTPPAPAQAAAYAPPSGLRIARGLGWGALYGQWWTILNLFWLLVWGGVGSATHGGSSSGLAVSAVAYGIVFAIVFGIAGSIIGLIIGAIDATPSTGAIIGIVAGLLFCGLEVLLTGSIGNVINIFFWFFTGRFVGAGIAYRVQRPVRA